MPGDWVEVRGREEILNTLDEEACLDGLPFMPEMAKFCGRRFRVYRRAHKTCDTVAWTGMRAMDDTVHLALLRCSGEAHGSCQAGCMLFWKEKWLRRVEGPAPKNADRSTTMPADASHVEELPIAALTSEAFERTVCVGRADDGNPIYMCQATRLPEATRPLAWWRPWQYVRDIRENGYSLGWIVRGIAISAFNTVCRRLGRPTYPRVAGKRKRTPTEVLDLQPGELVEVKSYREILDTLDASGRNRGMTFDAEMTPYCGKQFRVHRRIDQIIDEPTGRLVKLPNPCIVLDNVICTAKYHRFCPRSTNPYWREIWLRRVTETPT